MIFTATHSAETVLLTQFSLRHTIIEDGSNDYVSVLDLTTATDTEGIFVGESISFYADDKLIMTGTIDDLQQHRLVVSREDSSSSITKTSDQVIFYNKDNIRIAMDLSLKPLMTLSTDNLTVICNSVSHYYSDNAYTQATF